jgi:predicted DNA-binding antitoxin AbrB/MazE fold protein
MTEILDVIFENGVFKPLAPTGIPEGKRLRIRMESEPESRPEDILALAAEVFTGLTDDEKDEVEKIALSRQNFFADRSI